MPLQNLSATLWLPFFGVRRCYAGISFLIVRYDTSDDPWSVLGGNNPIDTDFVGATLTSIGLLHLLCYK